MYKFLFILLTPIYAFSQERLELSWDFFKHDKPINANFNAYLKSTIAYRFGIIGANGNQLKIRFEVKSVIDTTNSYFNFKLKGNDYKLLNHEQGHADITTIYALKLKDVLSKTKFIKSTYAALIKQIHAAIFSEMDKKQKEYDQETEHGNNELIQEKWNLFFKKELHLK